MSENLFGSSAATTAAQIDEEGLATEPATIEIPDWLNTTDFGDDLTVPEAGSFSPHVYPGVYPVRFELTPVYDSQTRQPVPGGIGFIVKDGVKYPQIQYTVYIQPDEVPADCFVNGERPAYEVAILFNSASAYVTRMRISRIGELVRTFRAGNPRSVGEAITFLQNAQQSRNIGRVEIGWRVFDKVASREITTTPNPKRKDKDGNPAPDTPWPLTSINGKQRPLLMVTFADGNQGYGRETVTRLLKPGKE